MPNVKIECTYCGAKYTEYLYTLSDTTLRCTHCKDKNLKLKKADDEKQMSDEDYYGKKK